MNKQEAIKPPSGWSTLSVENRTPVAMHKDFYTYILDKHARPRESAWQTFERLIRCADALTDESQVA